jgi:transposase
MKIVGCDLHTRYQQIAMLDKETGELIERRLEHESGEAREFYSGLAAPVRVGIEATGHTRWFERMLGELGHELWIGDAAQIRVAGGPAFPLCSFSFPKTRGKPGTDGTYTEYFLRK